MVSFLLACFLLWVLYLWFERHRLLWMLALSKPKSSPRRQTIILKPSPPLKTPSRPQFSNSKPTSKGNQFPPKTAGEPPRSTPKPAPEPVILPKVEINFEALGREATRRREEPRRAAPATQNQLYRLVHGDRAMMERLVEHTRSRNPNQAEQWIWEKTIRDLERDRH